MVICLEQGADLHMAQLMPLPLTVSCFSKIQIGFTFMVPANLGSRGKGPLNGCVCVYNIDSIGADSTGATGNFASVLTQEPGQTLRFAPVPFMAVL